MKLALKIPKVLPICIYQVTPSMFLKCDIEVLFLRLSNYSSLGFKAQRIDSGETAKNFRVILKMKLIA